MSRYVPTTEELRLLSGLTSSTTTYIESEYLTPAERAANALAGVARRGRSTIEDYARAVVAEKKARRDLEAAESAVAKCRGRSVPIPLRDGVARVKERHAKLDALLDRLTAELKQLRPTIEQHQAKVRALQEAERAAGDRRHAEWLADRARQQSEAVAILAESQA